MKSKTPWAGVIIVFLLFVAIALQSCTTSPVVEQSTNTEQTEKQSKRSTNPILCAILFLSVDCSVKEKDNVKLEPEVHAVPEEDPILELLIDLGEVEPDESN